MMNKLFNLSKKIGFMKSRYFKDIFNQAGLVVIAQLVPIAFSPLLSRIYDENAMAEITGLMAINGLLVVFSTFKLENAIVIEEDHQKSNQILLLGAFLALSFSLLTILAVVFLGDLISNTFEVQNVINYIPIYVLFFSFLNLLNFWFVRMKRFKMKAFSKIIENCSYVLFAVAIYFALGKNDYGMALGKVLGVTVALVVLFGIAKIQPKWYSWRSYKELLYKYKEFPLHYMPSSFVNVIGLQLLVVFIGIFYTKEQLGYFGLANMVILLPISFITQSVGTIFFQKTSEYLNHGNHIGAKKVFYQTLNLLMLIGIPVFLILYFGSSYLFPIIFGSNWEVTGTIAKFLSIVFLSQIIVGPISIVLVSLKKLKLNAFWQYGRFILLAIYMLLLVYYYKLNFLDFIRWYAYGAAILYLLYFLIINHEIRKLTTDEN